MEAEKCTFSQYYSPGEVWTSGEVAATGGGWRRQAETSREEGGGDWRRVAENGGDWRRVAETGGGWRRLAETGGEEAETSGEWRRAIHNKIGSGRHC